MSRATKLTSSYRLPSFEEETAYQPKPGVRPLGESIGGVSMFSNQFKRGHGNEVFGVDQRGIWIGAADFDDAPFRVDMEGNLTLSGIGTSITINDGSHDRIRIGFLENGF
jgi:hypothetical protein